MRRHRWNLQGQYKGQTGVCWVCKARFRWERAPGADARGRWVLVFSVDGGNAWAPTRPDCAAGTMR